MESSINSDVLKRIIPGIAIAFVAIMLFSSLPQTGNIAARPLSLVQDMAGFLYAVVFGPGLPKEEMIRIATWNVENWGKAKASDSERMEKIASVLSNYDIIAVQEISNVREKADPGCPKNEGYCPGSLECGMIASALQKYLNDGMGMNYSFVFSPQIRDERYLFVYNQEKAELLDSWLTADPEDSLPLCSLHPENNGLMIRQPFAARFRSGGFDFILLNVHTSPGRNKRELEGLDKIYKNLTSLGEKDIIIVGDLNADCSYLKWNEHISLAGPEYIWVVGNDADTTVGKSDCAYDRIIFTQTTREDFSGGWGIDMAVTKGISDHYPVWADFYTGRDMD